MNRKRIVLLAVVVTIVVAAGVLIGTFGQSAMRRLIEMHGG